MIYPFPQGGLSITEAVDWLAQRRDDEWTIWSVLQQVAWHEIREATRKGILRAYVLDRAGQSHEADRAQFAAPAIDGLNLNPIMLSLQEFRATTRRIAHSGQITGRFHLLPMDHLEDQVSGKLFFFLNDLKDVFGAPPEKPSLDEGSEAGKRPFPSSRKPELADLMRDFHRNQVASGGSCGENAAWKEARSRFSKYIIPRNLVRDARRTAGCLGKAGKRLNRAEK